MRCCRKRGHRKTPLRRTVIGILAYVDAGKTALSEAQLYESGAIRNLGRVDHGDAHMDTFALEGCGASSSSPSMRGCAPLETPQGLRGTRDWIQRLGEHFRQCGALQLQCARLSYYCKGLVRGDGSRADIRLFPPGLRSAAVLTFSGAACAVPNFPFRNRTQRLPDPSAPSPTFRRFLEPPPKGRARRSFHPARYHTTRCGR